MYMSYCRFEGTKQELAACLREVNDHIECQAEYGISEREIRHFKTMVYDFVDFLNDNSLLDDCGEIDREQLESVCKLMEKSFDVDEEEDETE